MQSSPDLTERPLVPWTALRDGVESLDLDYVQPVVPTFLILLRPETISQFSAPLNSLFNYQQYNLIICMCYASVNSTAFLT